MCVSREHSTINLFAFSHNTHNHFSAANHPEGYVIRKAWFSSPAWDTYIKRRASELAPLLSIWSDPLNDCNHPIVWTDRHLSVGYVKYNHQVVDEQSNAALLVDHPSFLSTHHLSANMRSLSSSTDSLLHDSALEMLVQIYVHELVL